MVYDAPASSSSTPPSPPRTMETKSRLELGTRLPDSSEPVCGIRRKLLYAWIGGGIVVILVAIGVGVGAGYALKPRNGPDDGGA